MTRQLGRWDTRDELLHEVVADLSFSSYLGPQPHKYKQGSIAVASLPLPSPLRLVAF